MTDNKNDGPVTAGRCNDRHRGILSTRAANVVVTAAGIAIAACMAVSLAAYSTASGAASDHAAALEYKQSVQRALDNLQQDVREIRAAVMRIEKNGR